MLIKIKDITPAKIASICDHTFLNRSEAYKEKAKEQGKSCMEIRKKELDSFLEETINFEFDPYAICVRPEDVAYTKNYLTRHKKENILIASVVGFPDGSFYSTEFKIEETKLAIKNGAKEIDMVLNYNRLKTWKPKDEQYTRKEIEKVTKTAQYRGALVKLILETSELNNNQKRSNIPLIEEACKIAMYAGVDFVKTSTGFGAYGAREEDLRIMKKYFPRGIKISGGVNAKNVTSLLTATSERLDGYINLNPRRIRIGESSLLKNLTSNVTIE